MSLARRKTFFWVLLATSIGGTVLFAAIVIMRGPPRGHEVWLWLWPVWTVALGIVSAIGLKKSYRAEPGDFSGFWHLSILDFYAVTIFTAALMGISRAAWPKSFVPGGIITALGFGFAYLFCLLLSARKGYFQTLQKGFHALSLLLLATGGMALGAFLVFGFCAAIFGPSDAMKNWIVEVLFFQGSDFGERLGIVNPIRIGLCGLVHGIALNRVIRSVGFRLESQP